MQTWRLFVDESGPLDGLEDSVVGGLLGPADALTEHKLRAELDAMRQRVFPCLPHPPHQAEINDPTSFLAWWMFATSPKRSACPKTLQGHMVALSRGVRRAGHPVTKAFIEQVESQKEQWRPHRRRADFRSTQRLDELLRERAPQSHGWLQARKEMWNLEMRALLSRLTEAGAVGLLAFEQAQAPARNEHYRAAFQAMVARAALICTQGLPASEETQEPQVTLELHVATRYVEHAGTEVRSSTPLLQEWAEGAVNAITPRVTVRVCSVEDYDYQVGSGIVIADFLANRARAVSQWQTWNQLPDTWHHRTELPATLQGLPTFECVGKPLEAVQDHLAGRPPKLPGSRWRWAEGETEAALAALSKARK